MLLFFYGTLKKGFYNYKRFKIDVYGEFIRNETLKGYSLVQPEGYPYPFCVKDNDGEVVGEVYKIEDQELIDILDQMERGAGYERVEINGVNVYVLSDQSLFKDERRFKEFI